ncbi:hypothetical protein [Nocardioides daphniae]|uniref:Uncharacterized protein n=1 Tax=Nocardioides daphniae TaxID=402297 RepID=A0A4V1CWF7_9ACTN|nr:hypothetical protein [Nocardioides daphniae]QCC77107.1 hypothetical protein E2C04_07585 [Nocardioides daphniae]GGD19698.1 hypothetical protein GCM10007231_18560 [Nocardioides daphniae]
MSIPTAPLVAVGLVGGYAAARFSGKRPLGGAVLAVAGAAAATGWTRQVGPVGAAALTAVYVGAFGASHPLAKKLGAWPSVGVVTAVATAAAAVADVKGR